MPLSFPRFFFLMNSILILAACGEQSVSPASPIPPDAEPREHIVSAPAGDRNDPYYWLRDDSRQDPELLALLKAENEYTQAMLADRQPLIEQLVDEMRERIPEEQIEAPYFDDGYWYYTRYESGGEYPIHARRKGTMDAPEEVLLDGNRMGQGEDYFRIGGWDVSPDGRRLVWLQDVVGRRQFRMMIRDLKSENGEGGDPVDTGISGVSSASWAADGNSIFYVENHPETLRSFRVKRHWPNEERGDESRSTRNSTPLITPPGSYPLGPLQLHLRQIDNHHGNADHRQADPEAEFEVFYPREAGHEYTADHVGDHWVVRTNWEAPNFRIMRCR